MALWVGLPLLAVVGLQRLGELMLARLNTARLLAEGGRQAGAGHYPLFIVLHTAWLASMGAWLLFADTVVVRWPLLGLFLVLQGARLWVIHSLGRFWTTRVIVVAARPLVRSGPYRFTRHPNYLIVALEIAVLPLAFGAATVAFVFTVLNVILLAHRIRVEEEALKAAADEGQGPAA